MLKQGWRCGHRGFFVYGLLGVATLLALTLPGRPQELSKPAGSPDFHPTQPAAGLKIYAQRPLSFERNRGQTDREVKFLARGMGYVVFLTGRGASIEFPPGYNAACHPAPRNRPSQGSHEHLPHKPGPTLLTLELIGANRAAKISESGRLPATANYFHGSDPKKWLAEVPTYAEVRYKDVYPGIDLVYHGDQRQLEYDFVVAPGADPKAITLAVETRNSKIENRNGGLTIAPNGDLLIAAAGSEVRFRKPVAYQEPWPVATDKGQRTRDALNSPFIIQNSKFVIAGDRVKFEIPNYDKTKPLVVDPTLAYSTYLGGTSFDQANGVAIDTSGNVYVTGFTQSANFPVTAGAFSATFTNNSEVFVSKFSPAGSLMYSTFLGSAAVSHALGIAVDAAGSAYITGQTFQADVMYPTTPGAWNTVYNGFGDAFVTKLSPDGSSLVYSGFLGGTQLDEGRAIAVDALGDAYVTGKTFSTDFPAVNAIQPANSGREDGFVAELNPSGSALIFSTYLGGGGFDQPNSIAVDELGNVYVTGSTTSSDFPAINALQPLCKGCPNFNNAFVTELAAGGASIVYSTYLGGSANDEGLGIAVDALGKAYVTGFTFSPDFPTSSGAYQTSLLGGSSAFVAQILPGGPLGYSTYLGSDSYTMGVAVAALDGNAYVTGLTHADKFPTVNAIQTTRAGFPDAFVAELNALGSSLYFSTYLGGNSFDEATGIAVNPLGDAIVTGHTASTNFPTTNPAQKSYGGGDSDAFLSAIHVSPISLSTSWLTFSGQATGTTSPAQQLTVTNNGQLPLTISGVAIGGLNSADFTQTGNCLTTLAAGGSCAIKVTFMPSATGPRLATLSVAADTSGSPPQTVGLSGTGVPPPVIVSPTALIFSAQQVNTTSSIQTVALSNTGATTLGSIGISITGANANQFQQTNNCGSSLAAGTSCAIAVTFKPTATGTMNAAVTIKDSAGNSPQSVALAGSGLQAVASVSPTSLNYANQPVDTAGPAQTVTLTNTGSGILAITGIAVTGGNSSDFMQSNNCGSTLAPGTNCAITVTFTPTAANKRSSTLAITDNAAGSPKKVTLAGTGTPAAGVVFSPTSVSFSNQSVGRTSAAQAVKLTNSGTAALSISGISLTGTNGGDFAETNNCPGTVAAGASCTLSVTFGPTAAGVRRASVSVSDGAGAQSVPLSGTGTAPAVNLALTALAFGFENVGTTSVAQSVKLTNSGNAPLAFGSFGITGTNSTDFGQTNNCGTSINAGGSCNINVTFSPKAAGARTAAVSITDNAVDSPQTISLSGTGASPGTAPPVTLLPASLSFGNQNADTSSSPQSVRLTNSSTAAISISAITLGGPNSSSFAETNSCSPSLAAGTSCTINVTFTPVATGPLTATLAVTDSAAGSPQTTALGGTGISTAAVGLLPGSLTFSSQAVATTSPAQTVTLSNPGTAALTVGSMGITGANAADFAETNNCGTSLAGGGSCAINVTFTAAAAGSRTATLTVSDFASDSPQTTSLTGTGIVPSVSLSPASLTFSGQLVNTTSAAQTVTLNNPQSTALTIAGIAFTGTNPGDFTETNNCGTSVGAGTSCTINVTFAPTAVGARSATLTVTDDASNSPQTAALSGAGTAPPNLSPSSLTFASQNLGTTSAPQAVTLSNPQSVALNIASIAMNGANAADFAQTNNCGTSLAAGANCTINVTFTPSTTGTRSATLTVTDDASNSPQTASLSGAGTSSSGGAVTLVTKAYGAYADSTVAASTITSGSFAVPAGGLIVAYCGVSTSVAMTNTISDTAGSAFVQVGTLAASSGGDALAMYYAPNAPANSTDSVTCNWDSAHHALAVMVLVYSGANPTAPLDATASGSSQGGTSIQTAAFSTNSASEVIVAGIISGSSCIAPPAPGSGYTMEIDALPSGCTGPVGAAEDQLVTTLQTNATASMTFAAGTYADMIVATFKAGP